MSKRFTATEKWSDPWFCSLTPLNKLFWIYLVENCNHAGIWQVNFPLVRFHLGEFIFDEEIFEDRIIKISDYKWYIPKFVEFQYGELQPDSRTHASVINILKKEGVYKGYTKGMQRDKGTVLDKGTDKGTDKEKDKEHDFLKDAEFISLWNDFKEMRKIRKKPITTRAEQLIFKELDLFGIETSKIALAQSIKNGWTGIFKPKDDTNKGGIDEWAKENNVY